MKRVFISVPMTGRQHDAILSDIDNVIKKFRTVEPYGQGEEVEFVHNLNADEPDEPNEIRKPGLWYLGQAIQQLSGCDACIFTFGWQNSKGCCIEHEVCLKYGIHVFYEGDLYLPQPRDISRCLETHSGKYGGLHLSGLCYESLADGAGVRAVIFVSGCLHKCPNCQSPMTHDFTAGKHVTEEMVKNINEELKKRTFLAGITLSGGDPFYSSLNVIKLLDDLYVPHNNIWAYSGFTFEEIKRDPRMRKLLERVDILVDGMYIEEKRDITLRFRGSSNQRIIDVRSSLKDPEGKVHLFLDGC